MHTHKNIGRHAVRAIKTLRGAGKALMAGAAAAALVAGNLGKAFKNTASDFKGHVTGTTSKKTEEVITMKKSTVVGLLVVLAAIAGALGALYMYVLRREKELDEYEQLLFSEDFDDDMMYDDCCCCGDEEEPVAEAAEEAVK